MQNVSNDYKTDFYKDGRNQSYIEITMRAVNNSINGTITSNNYSGYCDLSALENHAKYTYATLERGRWNLDGTMLLVPDTQDLVLNTGYISWSVSNSNGEFSTNPTIDITFDNGVDIPGIALTFDKNEPIIEYTVTFYKSSSVIYTKHITENEEELNNILYNLQGLTRIHIEIQKVIPYRRARILGIEYGIVQIFTNNNLIEDGAIRTDEIDILSRELPENSFDFTVDNSEHAYNFDNPQGVYSYLQEGMPITVRIGYMLDSGETEWQNSGTYYLSEWEATEYTATFKAQSKLSRLNQKVYDIQVTTDTRLQSQTLYNIVSYIMTNEGLMEGVDWIIDESLSNISIKAPYPDCTTAEMLQYIANVSNCILYTDKNNKIRIAKLDSNPTGYYLDFNKLSEDSSEGSLEPKLKSVNVTWYTYKVASSASQILSETITIPITDDGLYIYETTLDKATEDISVSVSGDAYLLSQGGVLGRIAYALIRQTRNDGTDSVTFTINGKQIEGTEHAYKLEVNEDGEECNINNPLITNLNLAKKVAQNAMNYLTKRTIYNMKYIGEPAIDMLDNINIQTQFSNKIPAIVTKNIITFNGAISGEIKIKRW